MNNLETMSTLRVYDSSSGQLQAPQTKLDAVPPKERTQSKTWKQVETSPAVVNTNISSIVKVMESIYNPFYGAGSCIPNFRRSGIRGTY
jgi:hypothetical protein